MIYCFYIFDRKKNCLYYREWQRETVPRKTRRQEQDLVFGFLMALKSFVEKTSPVAQNTFYSYTTTTYKLHYFEPATGLKFAMMTGPEVPNLQLELSKIYKDIYVEYVMKNPVYKVGEKIDCYRFVEELESYVKRHSAYTTSKGDWATGAELGER